MSVVIHAFPLSPRSFKVLWAAHQLDIAYDMKFVDFSRQAQRAPSYLRLNPNGLAPVLEHDGFVLWESNAILEYLASLGPGLVPSDTRGRLSISKWLYWESTQWDRACAIFAFERVVKPLFGLGETLQSEIDRGTVLFERAAKVLDGQLAQHRFVAGDVLSAADIALGSAFCLAEQARFPIEAHPSIVRWKAELAELPSWHETAALAGPRSND